MSSVESASLRSDSQALTLGWELGTSPPVGFGPAIAQSAPAQRRVPVNLPDEGHAIVFAGTGSGKTRLCLAWVLSMPRGTTLLINDPAAEISHVAGRYLQSIGPVHCLDPWGLAPLPSASLNPLQHIDLKSPDGLDDVRTLCSGMVSQGNEAAEFSSNGHFWTGRGTEVLTTAATHLLELRQGSPHPPTLADLRHLILEGCAAPSALADRLALSGYAEVRRSAHMLRAGAPETMGGIMLVADQAVSFSSSPAVVAATSTTTIPLAAIGEGGASACTALTVFPPERKESHRALLNQWWETLLRPVMRRRCLPKGKTYLILDEAASVTVDLPSLLALGRKHGLQVILFYQSPSQLRAAFPRQWQAVLDNVSAMIAFGCATMAAAEEIAAIAGSVSPEVLLDMPSDQMLVQLRGKRAFLALRADYLRDIPKDRFDPNPFYEPAVSQALAQPGTRLARIAEKASLVQGLRQAGDTHVCATELTAPIATLSQDPATAEDPRSLTPYAISEDEPAANALIRRTWASA